MRFRKRLTNSRGHMIMHGPTFYSTRSPLSTIPLFSVHQRLRNVPSCSRSSFGRLRKRSCANSVPGGCERLQSGITSHTNYGPNGAIGIVAWCYLSRNGEHTNCTPTPIQISCSLPLYTKKLTEIQMDFSRGRLYINTNNPLDPIVVDPQYYSHFAGKPPTTHRHFPLID